MGILEHDALVEDAGLGSGAVGQVEDLLLGCCVLSRVAGAESVVFEVGAEFCDGAEEKGVVEVEVRYPFWMSGEAVLVALKIGAPLAGCLVQVLAAYVGGDRGVHAADDAMEDAFFKTFVVEDELGFRGPGLDDVAESVGGFDAVVEGAQRGGGRDTGWWRGFEEAVFAVDSVPDWLTSIASVALWVVYQTDVVTLGGCRFVFWYTVVTLITFVIVLNDAAFPHVFAKCALKWTLPAPFLL